MILRVLAELFAKPLRLAPEELQVSLNFHDRQHRAEPPAVDSAAGNAISMMLYRPEPGQYVGLGRQVIAERRIRTNSQYTQQLRRAEDAMAAEIQDLIKQGYVNTIHDCWEKP